MHELALAIVGSGGDGAVSAGDIVAMACAHEGLHIIKTEAYGPQIRGGESSCSVRISTEAIYAQADRIDALAVFNWSDFARLRSELVTAADGVIFHEPGDNPPDDLSGCRLIEVPFAELARESGAHAGKNVVAIGVLAAVAGLPCDALRSAVRQRFAKKSAAVVEANLCAFEAGLARGKEVADSYQFTYSNGTPKLLMSGNEATAFAAIEAGCRFFAGYPITPSSEILHFFGEWLPKIGGMMLQTEDELSAIGAVIGASFAGTKAMTATSGPGLSLMAEMLGLASIAEIPVVIINVQRGGPSTGIPTKSEQSDLAHALWASPGDTPRVVLACCDVEDSFHTTIDAFNIAEEYQLPVIVLSDQTIAQRRETLPTDSLHHELRERRIPTPSELLEYRRYRHSDDGVSPMSVPGMPGGIYQTNGLEHDERGRPNSMHVVHEQMNAKRYMKLDAIARRYRLFRRYGPEHADIGILCWGSSSGPVREAIEHLNGAGARVAAFIPRMLMPLPVDDMQAFIDGCGAIVVIEVSYSQQFYRYLRTELTLPAGKTHVHSRSGGKALGTDEVERAVRRCLATKEAEEVLA